MHSDAYPAFDSACTWQKLPDGITVANPAEFRTLVHEVVPETCVVLARRLYAAAAAWQLPVDTSSPADAVALQRWATTYFLNGDLVWKPFQDDALVDAVNGGGFAVGVPRVAWQVQLPEVPEVAADAGSDDTGSGSDDASAGSDDDNPDMDDLDAMLAHETHFAPAMPSALRLTHGDDASRAIQATWHAHIATVTRAIRELLHGAVAAFLDRAVDQALPAEQGILQRSWPVTRLLYGNWVQARRKDRAMLRVWSGYDAAVMSINDVSRARGILRLILMHVAENATALGGHVGPMVSSLVPQGTAAAELLCAALASQYCDAPLGRGSWVMDRTDIDLVCMLSRVVHITPQAVVKYILSDPRFVPYVESDNKVTHRSCLHVHHVVENVLTAIQHGTFPGLKPKHVLPPPACELIPDAKRHAWLHQRARLRQAVELAYAGSPHEPLDAVAFQRLCAQCDTDNAPLTHVLRACFLLVAALSATGAVHKSALADLEFKVLRRVADAAADAASAANSGLDLDLEMDTADMSANAGAGSGAAHAPFTAILNLQVPCIVPFVTALLDAAVPSAEPSRCRVPAFHVEVATHLPARDVEFSWQWWATWGSSSSVANSPAIIDGPCQAKVLQSTFHTGTVWPPSGTAAEQVLPNPVAAPHAAAAILGWGRLGMLPTWTTLLQGICHDDGGSVHVKSHGALASGSCLSPSNSLLPAFALLWHGARAHRAAFVDAFTTAAAETAAIPDTHTRTGHLCSVCGGPMHGSAAGANVLQRCPVHAVCFACATEELEARALRILRGSGSDSANNSHALKCMWPRCPHAMVLCSGDVDALLPPELASILQAAVGNAGTAAAAAADTAGIVCAHCGARHAATWTPATGRHLHTLHTYGAVYVCADCGGATCTQCSRCAHAGTVCLGPLHPSQTPQEVLTAAKVQLCPDCGTPTVKNLACNHITCEQCWGHWCWACGCRLAQNDITAHYRSASPACNAYSSQTEQARMQAVIQKWATEGTVSPATAAAALELLYGTYVQTQADL